ncbi:MAG TPA: hypothetical protein DIU00_13820 [Phycisphaerales bacterium]|nr:hypothetical protein [Phycisphaerales bacterium]
MSPQALIFPISSRHGRPFFAKKQIFYRNFTSGSDSMNVYKNEELASLSSCQPDRVQQLVEHSYTILQCPRFESYLENCGLVRIHVL